MLRALEEEEHDEHEEHEGEEEEHGHEEEAFGTVENSDSETDGASIGASYVADRGFIGFSITTFGSNYGVPGHAHEHEEEEPPAGEEEEEEIVRIDLEQVRFDVRGDLELDGLISEVKFRAARNDYEHTEFEGAEVGTLYETDGTDARLELHHRPTDTLEGAIGVQFKSIDFTAIGDEAFVPPSDTRRTSLFAFEELKLSDTLVLQGSFRAERQTIDTPAFTMDYSDTALGASVGAVWTLTDMLDLSANLSVTERRRRRPNSVPSAPSHGDVAAGCDAASVALGDGILDKETSTNLDVTLRGGDGPFEWTVTGWMNSADDYILAQPTGAEEDGFQVFEYRQRDVDLYGAEVEARIEMFDGPVGHLHGRLFSDFVHAEESASGAYVARMPPLRVGGGLHFTRDALEASISATWHADQDNTAPNELRTDGYALLSAEELSWFMQDQGDIPVPAGQRTCRRTQDARRRASPLKDTVPLRGRALHAGLRWIF
ncbi:MAG: TonB-dependent receptor [Woeseiaceae bacterium]|nr:TonB-dependent receptor [Woeseiaceae bacterium]